MTLAVFDFTSIARKLNCQEQKADFEEKNPKAEPNKVVWHPVWGYGAPVPLADGCGSTQAGRITGGSCESVTIATADLPPYSPSDFNEAARKFMAENSKGFNLPDLRDRVKWAERLAQCALDAYKVKI